GDPEGDLRARVSGGRERGQSLFSRGVSCHPAASPDGDAWGNARGPRGRPCAGDGAEGSVANGRGACFRVARRLGPLSVTGRKRQQGSQACRSRAADRAAPPAVRLPSHLNAFRVTRTPGACRSIRGGPHHPVLAASVVRQGDGGKAGFGEEPAPVRRPAAAGGQAAGRPPIRGPAPWVAGRPLL